MSASPPRKQYAVLYADPPWTFTTYSAKGKGRSAEAHYRCLRFDDLCRLPVGAWAADDSVLLLWVPDPQLAKGLALIEAWGFSYKTVGFYWAKLNKTVARPERLDAGDFFTGLGYWTRAGPEMCLLATRGAPKRRARNVRRLVIAPRREHSRKPDEVYERIERLADGPYLELFARARRPGWESWGEEVGLFDHVASNGGTVATRRWPSDLARRPPPDIVQP